jgi:hypothetical protein
MKTMVEPEFQAEFEQFVRTGDASPGFLEKLATDERLQKAADRAFAEEIEAFATFVVAPADRVAQAAGELANLPPWEREKEVARLKEVTEQRPEVKQLIAEIAGVSLE